MLRSSSSSVGRDIKGVSTSLSLLFNVVVVVFESSSEFSWLFLAIHIELYVADPVLVTAKDKAACERCLMDWVLLLLFLVMGCTIRAVHDGTNNKQQRTRKVAGIGSSSAKHLGNLPTVSHQHVLPSSRLIHTNGGFLRR
jgi:hypothetical protein